MMSIGALCVHRDIIYCGLGNGAIISIDPANVARQKVRPCSIVCYCVICSCIIALTSCIIPRCTEASTVVSSRPLLLSETVYSLQAKMEQSSCGMWTQQSPSIHASGTLKQFGCYTFVQTSAVCFLRGQIECFSGALYFNFRFSQTFSRMRLLFVQTKLVSTYHSC